MWTFEQIYEGALNDIEEANYPGIYKVYIPDGFIVEFKSETDAVGDNNNTKPVQLLKRRIELINNANKDEGKKIIYIGKTNETLKKRVYCLARYGYGEVKNHRGGYPIWQIKDNKRLLVELIPSKLNDNPDDMETELLDCYIDLYGTEPIANTAVGKNSKYMYIRSTDTYVWR